MDINTFSTSITQKIQSGGWAPVAEHLHTINLPDGWQAMVQPFFDGLKGKPLEHSLQSPDTFTREELHWPAGTLPTPLDEVEQILVLAYVESDGEDKSSGRFTFPLLEVDGQWKIVLVG